MSNFVATDIEFGNGTYVMVGGQDPNKSGEVGGVRISSDGTNWTTPTTAPADRNWLYAAYGNNMWVIAESSFSTGWIATSTDNGVNWTETDLSLKIARISMLKFANGQFLMAGLAKPAWYQDILSSTNGTTWASAGFISCFNQNGGCNSTTFQDGANDIVYASGRYVVTATRSMATSTDLVNWTPITVPANFFSQYLTYGNGKFLAHDQWSSNVLTSTDGMTFTSSAASGRIARTIFVGDEWFGVDTNPSSKIYRSSDGITWSESFMDNDPDNNPATDNLGFRFTGLVANGGDIVAVTEGSYSPVASKSVKTSLPPSVSPASQTITGTAGTAITASTTLVASFFQGTVSYAVTNGALPAGLTMNSSTGVISGTPTSGSSTTVTVTGTGATFGTATATVTFNIANPPSVSSVSPTSGPAVGGTSITVSGSAFVSGATVTVGGATCASVSVVSAISLTCTTPAGSAGAVDVVVTNPDSLVGIGSGLFTYVAAPAVSSVSPTSGPAVGGTSITVTGTGFVSGATVSVGGAVCASVSVVSATKMTCSTPAGSAGAVDVVVTNPDSQVGTGKGMFTYVATATTTTTTVAPTTTTTPANQPVVAAGAPTLITPTIQSQLTAAPGEANALINGKVVPVETVKVPVDASPASQIAVAEKIVDEIADVLPKGTKNPLAVVETPEGAEISGLMTNPDDPTEKLNVPVESVTLVKAGESKVLISALNQTNLPAEVVGQGILQVTRGGLVAAQAYGLPGLETGEIVLMSTPRLLKSFTVDKNGTYAGQVPLPKDISFGSHTVVMATKNAKVSLGIKLVRTKMQFRIKRKIGTTLFKNRAGVVKKGGGKVTISATGRCRANSKRIVMASKPGGCYITVRQAAKGNNKAIYYRFTVSVVKKVVKPKISKTKK